jgi:carbon-monoxide dehydrogenase medium subunit
MYPAAFRYLRPRNLDDARSLYRAAEDARYLAGGQTLIPAMRLRLAQPGTLIDIARIAELNFIAVHGDELQVGAGVRHADVAMSADVRRHIPALAELAGLIGDPAVRHRGTLGGALANNDPAADYPAAVLALNARVQTTEREIAADAFFTGIFATALAEGEIVTSVSFPKPLAAAYTKFRNPASRYAIVGVFVARTREGVRVAVTGAGSCVFRSPDMEAALERSFTPDALAAIRIPADGLQSDLHASAAYRAHLIPVMAQRAVAAALERDHG